MPVPAHDEQQHRADERPTRPTDDELGERFIAAHTGEYVLMYGAWYAYHNGVWMVSESAHERAAWDVLKHAKKQGIRPNETLAKSVLKYAGLYLRPVPGGGGEHVINLCNGVYDLRTHRLEPHAPELYLTSQLPFEYDPKAECPTFLNFLRATLVLPNEPDFWDEQLIRLVQQAIGYSLTEDTSHRASFWLVGPSGSGKSTLMNVLIALAGDSHVSIDLDALNRDGYQLADLPGKRVVTFTEPSTGSVLADGHYKRLVSNDTITARHVYGKPFRFVPVGKVWGAMNALPRVLDRSEAVFSRVIIIPMSRAVPEGERDRGLQGRLMAELPGIFNWAMQGLADLRARGAFVTAEQSEAARADYRSANDTEAAFVEEQCDVGAEHWVGAQVLYDAYSEWCKANGLRPKGSRAVGDDWKRLGFVHKRSNGSKWYGVRVRPAERTIF